GSPAAQALAEAAAAVAVVGDPLELLEAQLLTESRAPFPPPPPQEAAAAAPLPASEAWTTTPPALDDLMQAASELEASQLAVPESLSPARPTRSNTPWIRAPTRAQRLMGTAR
ncbi:unnamed protein product, partial [Polarella glacialis]